MERDELDRRKSKKRGEKRTREMKIKEKGTEGKSKKRERRR